MPTIEEALAEAMRHHQAGRLPQAELFYRQVLQAQPANANALHLLGVLAHQAGHSQAALEFLKQSVAHRPHDPASQCNLGVVHQSLRNWDEAIACYRQSLSLNPEAPETHLNLGKSLQATGHLADAISSYREAARLGSANPETEFRLGTALYLQGDLVEAEACLQKSVRMNPGNAQAFNSLGSVRAKQRNFAEAEACFRQALKLLPNYPEAHNNLGNVLCERVMFEEAAARLRPSPPGETGTAGLGRADGVRSRLEEAVNCFREAMRLQPEAAGTCFNLGNALRQMRRYEESRIWYQQALRLQPDYLDAGINLGNALLDEGKLDQAAARFREAMRHHPDSAAAHGNLLFCLSHMPAIAPEELFAEHLRWGERHGRVSDPLSAPDNDPAPARRLRIGYVSPDFRDHVVALFFEPVLANHDPAQVETYCYAEVAAPDSGTQRLQSLANVWRFTCGDTDLQLAKRIRADRIDILVDLAGHTADNRLRTFAYKPAPVQATYLGYPHSTGLRAVDYRLTDAVVDPAGDAATYAEELIRLPSVCCFGPPSDAPAVRPPPAMRNGYITFGSLHRLSRLNLQVLDVWRGILRAVPSARLLILRHTLQGRAREELLRQFTDHGIAAERIDLRNWVEGPGRHMAIHREIDISLDTFPWSGHTTACESLWMGVPVLTLRGRLPAGRMVASVLTQAGLADWIADSPEQYLELAVKKASDTDSIARLRERLRERLGESLCDGKSFTRALEASYREMWQKWCADRMQTSL